MDAPLWQVLTPTIPHRHARLAALLALLDAQARPGFGLLLYRDNLVAGVAAKRQALLDASAAEYVSFIDDDDWVPPYFTYRVLSELGARPDYVGFTVAYTEDGQPGQPALHSIRYDGWHNWPEHMVRDISHLNPVRREIAARGRFSGGDSEDYRWAAQIREARVVHEEAWIPEVMYRYQFDSSDCHRTRRKPWSGPLPELPAYPWLTVLKTPESC
jgi:hypothetical protein